MSEIPVDIVDDKGGHAGCLKGELHGEHVTVQLDRPHAYVFAMFATFLPAEIGRYGDDRFREGLTTASENVEKIKQLADELSTGTRLGRDAIADNDR